MDRFKGYVNICCEVNINCSNTATLSGKLSDNLNGHIYYINTL